MKYFFAILFLFVTVCSHAQVLSNNGAVGTILAGTVVNGGTVTNTSGTISNSGTLTLTADLTNAATINGSGMYNVAGNFTNNSIFTAGTSTVTFNGSSAQSISGSAVTSFNSIVQSNSAGVSLSQHANLVDELNISSGTFTTTGFNFTLISDASRTARIAAIPTGANLSGNIIMQRYTGTGPTDWRFFSSAVSGVTIADWADDFATSGFTGSTQPGSSFVSIYSYNESVAGVKDNGFVAATSTANSIVVGSGYWVYLGPNPVTYELTGPPNTFTISPTITYSVSGGIDEDGWNLIANPYPSAIDWDDANWTKTNVDNAVYIYNSSTGNFASYIAGAGLNGGSRYIASQQGFWIKANAAGPAITLVENVKADQDPSYLKSFPGENVSYSPMAFQDFPIPPNTNSIPNSIKLTASGNGLDDETLIRFMPGASINFDGNYDAWKLQNLNPSSPNISSVVNGQVDIAINSLPALNADVAIPIRMIVPSEGTYSIRRDSTLMIPLNSCIILEDLANGNMIDLRSTISYSFTISDTTNAPRFILHICDSVSTGITEKELSSGMNVIYDNGEVYLDFDLSHATDAAINVYSLVGDKIFTKDVYHIQKNRIKLDLQDISQGVYVVRMNSFGAAGLQELFISKKILITR